ncbi:MAG: phage/plasmid primase, P4 family [Candidatus Electryoneaceae bacterium]|nr:phage/plasmid primase, P4 family [Candidatus Electryoneaceae bacterium]
MSDLKKPPPSPMMTVDDAKRIRAVFPAEMLELPKWVAYRMVWKAALGKFDKIPVNPNTGYNAKTNVPTTWGSFDIAVKLALKRKLGGVGFVFKKDDPYVGIDLDKCVNGEGEIEPWATEIITELNSYTEKSPSGKGYHIIGQGKLPPQGRRNGKVEMYETGRFFTVTGLVEGPGQLRDIQKALDELHARLFKKPKGPSSHSRKASKYLSDDELIAKALKATNSTKFNALWSGDWKSQGYPSISEADQALCNLLGWWTNYNPARIDALFRQSALFRSEKWDKPHHADGKTYGQGTIDNAVEGHSSNEGYNPNTAKGRSYTRRKKKTPIKVGGYYLTEIGNAERLVAKHGINLHFCHEWSKWLVWDERRWDEDKKGQVNQLAKETVRAIYADAQDASQEDREVLIDHARRSETANKIRAMISLAASESSVPVLSSELDKGTFLLSVNNGTLDLTTGDLHNHNRHDMITKLAPVDYDPLAQCPVWEAFLFRIMSGNQAVITFLQRCVGYSLTGDVGEQALFFLYGTGANGKTTFLKTLLDMMGEYGKQAEPGLLIQKNLESHPTGVAELSGSRFVSTTEVEEGRRMAETLVKQMTGGDRQKGRFMRQDWFEFEPTYKLWLAANHRPVIRSTDYGMWRRIRLIPFEVCIPVEEQDKKLPSKLKKELPGILTWAVKGCIEWQLEGLGEPTEVKNATNLYQEEMDVLGGFISEICVLHPDAIVKVAKLYKRYKEWCDQNKEMAFSQRRFGSMLVERGFVRKRGAKGVWIWCGIGEGDVTGGYVTNTSELDLVDPEDIEYP